MLVKMLASIRAVGSKVYQTCRSHRPGTRNQPQLNFQLCITVVEIHHSSSAGAYGPTETDVCHLCVSLPDSMFMHVTAEGQLWLCLDVTRTYNFSTYPAYSTPGSTPHKPIKILDIRSIPRNSFRGS